MKQIDVGCRPVHIIKHLNNGVIVGETVAEGYIAQNPHEHSWREPTFSELYTCGVVSLFGKQVRIITLIGFLTYITFEGYFMYLGEFQSAIQLNISLAMGFLLLAYWNLMKLN